MGRIQALEAVTGRERTGSRPAQERALGAPRRDPPRTRGAPGPRRAGRARGVASGGTAPGGLRSPSSRTVAMPWPRRSNCPSKGARDRPRRSTSQPDRPGISTEVASGPWVEHPHLDPAGLPSHGRHLRPADGQLGAPSPAAHPLRTTRWRPGGPGRRRPVGTDRHRRRRWRSGRPRDRASAGPPAGSSARPSSGGWSCPSGRACRRPQQGEGQCRGSEPVRPVGRLLEIDQLVLEQSLVDDGQATARHEPAGREGRAFRTPRPGPRPPGRARRR